MRLRAIGGVLGSILVLGCGDDPVPPVGSGGGESSSTGHVGTTGGPGSSSGAPGDPTGGGTSTGSAVDSTGADSTGPGPGSSSEGGEGSSSGEPPKSNGCADGEREALIDPGDHPDIAACSGGWMFPGVFVNTPLCDREGGDDGPNPNGMKCSIEDLCSEGWHVCEDQGEVMAAGIADCDVIFWGGAFFATRQSGTGDDACGPMGLNDVFGCGDIGYAMISGCGPLNRSAGNLCVELPMPPWACGGDVASEADQLVKSEPQFGGALCCRD